MEITEATSVRDRRVRSIAAVPLRVRGELWGALYLDHRFTRSAFAAEDLAYLTTFAQHAALAIETAELRAKTRPASARLDAEALPPSPGAPRSADAARARCGPLVGASGPMQELYDGIERAARGGDAPVLIVGETGTGKELVARAIDALRAGPGPFVSQSCPALSEGTLEAELFGVRRGAYTGALDRRGLFARAEGGTLLLDEVGEASPRLQVTLLRVLQERCFRPLGAEREEPIRCRILTTTRHSLQRLVAEGSFREDLFYRLDVLRLNLPPLRERGADLELLVEALYPGAQAPRVRSDTWQLLRRHTWPGNVRELENEVLRWASAGLSEVLPQSLSQSLRESPQAPSSGRTLAALERDAIAAALVETGGNKAAAAKLLGIPRSTLNHRIRKQGLE